MPDAPSPSPSTPDALLIPKTWGADLSNEDYSEMVCAYGRSVLGGGQVFARAPLPGGVWVFITRNPRDTQFHEYGHPRQLKPRYEWTDRPDGSRTGVLTADATPTPPFGQDVTTQPESNPLAKLMAEKRRKRV